jgi:hypothetical protein
VEVVEGVLMHEVGFVDQEDGEEALLGKLLDMVGDGEEDVARSAAVRDGEGRAEVAIEVAAPEGNVVAVGHAHALGSDRVAEGTQDACLADTGLAGDHGVFLLLNAFDEIVDEGAFGRSQSLSSSISLENGKPEREK